MYFGDTAEQRLLDMSRRAKIGPAEGEPGLTRVESSISNGVQVRDPTRGGSGGYLHGAGALSGRVRVSLVCVEKTVFFWHHASRCILCLSLFLVVKDKGVFRLFGRAVMTSSCHVIDWFLVIINPFGGSALIFCCHVQYSTVGYITVDAAITRLPYRDWNVCGSIGAGVAPFIVHVLPDAAKPSWCGRCRTFDHPHFQARGRSAWVASPFTKSFRHIMPHSFLTAVVL